MLEGGRLADSRELDFEGFSELVNTLEVQYSESDRRAIFAMINLDGSSTIDAGELKEALRSSGALKNMYEDNLKTFGLLLAATLAFDGSILFFKSSTAAFDFLAA
uniref:EF-hand domain-containing protein n=1 Tax=Coccolithus braarudii TaxID=221442 RepID=A0A7S0LP28_9EUKA|mmetsp:Transcript_46779/g.99799  ORF Transcript_46779/g.99799 Transcript_46779/m.99799 type:complete len:105 (+) Transcript_46779:384-698(+)